MAVKNVSTKEKTIRGMAALFDSDAYVIDKCIMYGNYDGDFDVVVSNILDLYKPYFDMFLDEIEIDKKYFYQPAAFAEHYYGTPDLDFLVLYFAGMKSLFEFTREKIKVLPPTRLLDINRIFVEYKSAIKESYNNPTQYIEPALVEIKK